MTSNSKTESNSLIRSEVGIFYIIGIFYYSSVPSPIKYILLFYQMANVETYTTDNKSDEITKQKRNVSAHGTKAKGLCITVLAHVQNYLYVFGNSRARSVVWQ